MLHQSSPMLAAAASPAFLAKGCVNVVELDELKERAGDRWPRVREGVYAYLEGQLRSRLGPTDLFVRLGDIAYLVTMPTTDAEDVSAICLRVSHDLYRNFLGECDIDWIHLNTVVSADANNLVLSRITPETVVRLAERAGLPELLIKASGPEKKNRPLMSANLEAPPADPLAKRKPPSEGNDTAVPVRADLCFTPVWSVPNAAVTSYACEAKSITVLGRPESIPISVLTPRERLSVEMAAFRAGVEQLTKAQHAVGRFILIVPLSFDILGSPNGRMEIMAMCRDLSYSLRPYLNFLIYDVPPGVAQTRLANLVNALRPFGRGVLATIAPNPRAYTAYQSIGLQAIGYDLREFTQRTPFNQHDAEQLSQFARRAGLGTFLLHVGKREILKFAQDANIQMLSGPVVAPDFVQPKGMLRRTWGEILSQPETELWV